MKNLAQNGMFKKKKKRRCGGACQETEEAEEALSKFEGGFKRKSSSRVDDNKPKLSQSTPIKLHLPKLLFLLDTKKGVTCFFSKVFNEIMKIFKQCYLFCLPINTSLRRDKPHNSPKLLPTTK